jgi:ribulose-5-phosphate 4-epimerase/fuculose-1-phosphate aldolase
MTDLADLVRISAYGGSDVRLSQGGGGNTSVKRADGTLAIKASGFRLAEVTESAGWLGVSLDVLNRALRDPAVLALPPREAHEASTAIVQKAAGGGTLRPSLETSFHAWLPDRLVLHTHSVWANLYSCVDGGRDLLKADGFDFAWVPYTTPGLLLGLAVERAWLETGSPFILLENHGWITTGATADEAISRHESIRAVAEKRFGALPEPILSGGCEPAVQILEWANAFAAASTAIGKPRVARPPLRSYLSMTDGPCPTKGALVPDDVVYGIHAVQTVPAGVTATRWVERGGADGPMMGIAWREGGGFVLFGPSERAVATIEENLVANVMLHAITSQAGQTARTLAADEIAYLAGMDSEAYRQRIAARARG